MKFRIRNIEEEDEFLYWSNEDGWTDHKDGSDEYTVEEKVKTDLPMGGDWEEDYSEESDASYERMYAHNPRMEAEDDACLLDCDPRMGHATQEEFDKAIEENRLWTVVEAEGELYAEPGYHYVNRISHHICEIPYKSEVIEPEYAEADEPDPNNPHECPIH